jgi:hypothetical protein
MVLRLLTATQRVLVLIMLLERVGYARSFLRSRCLLRCPALSRVGIVLLPNNLVTKGFFKAKFREPFVI